MRLPLVVVAVSFLSCSSEPQSYCTPALCSECCTAEGVCVPCPVDGGTGGGTAGGAAAGGGSAGGAAGGVAGGAQAGGSATGGGQGGGHATGGGGAAGGGTGGGSVACTSGSSCMLGGDGGWGLCCGGLCKASNSDVLNCGGCGVQCPAGSSCAGSRCSVSCSATSCPSGTQCTTNEYGVLACYPAQCTGLPQNSFCGRNDPRAGKCCGNVCLDTENDVNNCGYCGQRCSAGQDCFYGSCEARINCATAPANSLCRKGDAGYGQCCGGQCVSLTPSTDPDNCGGCGLYCALGDTCSNGQCLRTDGGAPYGCYNGSAACPSGTSCQSSGGKCVTDTCSGATFGAPCSGPAGGQYTCCNAGCVDLYSDPNNCSACGKACAAGQFCDYGQCRVTPTCGLANSGADCPVPGGGVGHCCGGSCVNPTTNAQNCGACGAACPAGEICKQSWCAMPDGGYLSACGGLCPSGTVCDGNKCLPLRCAVGSTGEVCGFGIGGYQTITGRCCNGACVDTLQDPANCSACGASCTSGLCVASGPVGIAQAACYAPVSTTGCAFSCPSDMFCAGGRCNPKTCQGPGGGGFCLTSGNQTGVCCSQGFSTVCLNPSNDPANCGGCGVSCGSGGTCNNGVCSTLAPPCSAGHLGQFCDLDAGTNRVCCPNGGCIDVKFDDRNCGRCGNVCAAGLSCVNGGCIALTCTSATQNQGCASDAGIGSCCSSQCVQRSTDPLNCGQCGRICVASETCAGSACGVDVCDATNQGATCHRDAGSGLIGTGQCCSSACLDTRRDRLNCGGCGRVCPGDAGCVSGNCQ